MRKDQFSVRREPRFLARCPLRKREPSNRVSRKGRFAPGRYLRSRVVPNMPVFFLVVALCVVERGEVDFRPSAAEAKVPERFRLEPETFSFEREPLRRTP